MLRRAPFLVAALGLSLVACTQTADAPARPYDGRVRLATYNIQWFGEDANPARISNLKSVLRNLDPDIVALQEIQSKRALRQVFSDNWQIAIADAPEEDQELAVAVRKPFILVSSELIFTSPALDFAFPGKRDVLRAVIQTPDNRQVVVYSVHMKSRRGGRMTTDHQRETGAGLLAAYLSGKRDEPNVVVMGDFNDAPNDRSARILATGNVRADAGGKPPVDPVMFNATEAIFDQDAVTIGVADLFEGQDVKAVAPGAKADNDRLRGKDYNFPADVKVTQSFFDQIFVSPVLAKGLESVSVYSRADALRGDGGRTSVDEATGRARYDEKGDRASDHLPVLAVVRLK